MRVLIICNDFPPLNSIGARRPASWFQWFKKKGVEPVVVTKQWNANVEMPEDVLKNSSASETMHEQNEFGNIIRVPVKLIPPEKLLLRYGISKKKLYRKFLTLIYKSFSFCFFSFDKHRQLYEEARKFLQQEKVDAILITGEPFVLFRYGYLLKKEFGIPWIADYRDGWKLNHVARFQTGILNHLLQRWEFYFEKKFISNSSLITAPDNYLGEKLGKLHRKNFRAVFNGFDEFLPPKRMEHPDSIGNNSQKLLLAHTGTLTQGQRVEFLLSSILELHEEGKISPEDIQIQFVGLDYYEAQSARVKNFNPKIFEYIKTTPRISRERAMEINSSSDLLIAFTEENYQAIFAKVYDYLAAQKPILVLPSDDGLLSAIVSETQSGISFSEKDELKKFLADQIQLKKSEGNSMQISSDREKVLFYSRENQSAQMVQFIKELIRK